MRTDRRPTTHRGRPCRGVAATELALMLPVLIFIVLATVDFARVFYFTTTLTSCAYNGALYASSPGTESRSPYADVTAAARADASDLGSTTVTVDPPTYSATANGTYSTALVPNGYVKVNVNFTFTTIFTYPGIPHTMTLSRSVIMRMIPP